MRRGSSTARGYDHTHRKTRTALLPHAIGTMCPGANGGTYRSPRCDGVMSDPRRMQLDHTVPLAMGGGRASVICCTPCNTGAGAAMGNRMRGARRQGAARSSRSW